MNITFEELTTIPAAVALRLSPEQVASRVHALELYGDDLIGCYIGTQALQFKAGETVEILGDLPKGILPIYDQLRGETQNLASVPAEPEINELAFENPLPEIKTFHKKQKITE
jgi:hypothetical protein